MGGLDKNNNNNRDDEIDSSKRPEPIASEEAIATTPAANAYTAATITQVIKLHPSHLPPLRGNPIHSPDELEAHKKCLLEDEEDVDLKSLFGQPCKQEDTEDKELATSILLQVATAFQPRTAAATTKNTGNSPVAATAATIEAFSTIAAAVSAPGPTATIVIVHQDAGAHTPAQTVIFDETAVEMEAVR